MDNATFTCGRCRETFNSLRRLVDHDCSRRGISPVRFRGSRQFGSLVNVRGGDSIPVLCMTDESLVGRDE